MSIVVVSKWKVSRDSRQPIPGTERKNVKVPKSWYEQELRTIESDPSYLGRVELNKELTNRLNEVPKPVNIPTVSEIQDKSETVTWNQVVKLIKGAKSIEEARDVFQMYPQFHDSKAVTKAFESKIEKLASDED